MLCRSWGQWATALVGGDFIRFVLELAPLAALVVLAVFVVFVVGFVVL